MQESFSALVRTSVDGRTEPNSEAQLLPKSIWLASATGQSAVVAPGRPLGTRRPKTVKAPG